LRRGCSTSSSALSIPCQEHRYATIDALRHDLALYRQPIEGDRDAVLERITRRLERQRSQAELERLLDEITRVQDRDPGHPATRATRERIEAELHRLAVLSDLDAARIYLESSNWSRAAALLAEVAQRAADPELSRARLLLELAEAMQASRLSPVPAGIPPAIDALVAEKPVQAARILLTTPESRETAQHQQWLLAERIQAYVPEVVVLRPHLLKLQLDLERLQAQHPLGEPLNRVDVAYNALESAETGTLETVMAAYAQLGTELEELAAWFDERITNDGMTALAEPLNSAGCASEAVRDLLAYLKTTTSQASSRPEQAQAALVAAAALDPVNPVFESIGQTLMDLQALIQRLADYRPAADGADLSGWFTAILHDFEPYTRLVPDPRLGMMVGSLQDAGRQWAVFQQAVIAGNRQGAVDSLQRAADAVRRLNPELAVWLNNARNAVNKARYVQRHALNGVFGRAMADGWSAWDRGSGIEAERLGKQALEAVVNDAEQAAADRLIRLGKHLRAWKEGNGEGDPALTERIDTALIGLLTEDEDRHWQTFTEQMPSKPAYLNAMGPGLIEHFELTSTAAQRIMFFHFVLRGVIEMYDSQADDADFWRQAAQQALPNADQHIAYMALNNVIRDRQVVEKIALQVDGVNSIKALGKARQAVTKSQLQLVFKPLLSAMQQVEHAIEQWGHGDFRGAGETLETALAQLGEGEHLAHIQLDAFRAWVERLYQTAAELSVTRQRIGGAVDDRAEVPDARLFEWHRKLTNETELFLDKRHARVFKDWQATYEAMHAIYTDEEKRRSRKLREFDDLFGKAGVDTHPAYPLYLFWRDTVEASSEFPAPPTDEPVPRYTEDAEPLPARRPLFGGGDANESGQSRRRPGRRVLLYGAGLVLLLVVILFGGSLLLNPQDPGSGIAVTWETITPTLSTQQAAAATIGAIQTATAEVAALLPTATETPLPSDTPTPTASPTETQIPTLAPGEDFLPTAALILPSNTPLPTATETPTPEPTVTFSPTPAEVIATQPAQAESTAAAQGASSGQVLQGAQQILLALEQNVQAYPWPESWFRPGDLGGGWLLGVPELDQGNDLLQVVLPADLLEQLFGPEAAVRLRRIEVTLTLRDYDSTLVQDELVYFGLGLQGADESRVALQVQMVRQDAINVGARVGDEFRARTTLPIYDARVKLALERLPDGSVTLLLDDEAIGPPRFLTAPNAPVTPYLFVQQGGVVVSVTDLVAVLD
jgi:stage V sporulation protein SpoVS